MSAPDIHPARMPSWQLTDPAQVTDASTAGAPDYPITGQLGAENFADPTDQAAAPVAVSRRRKAVGAARRHPFRTVFALIGVGALGMGVAPTMASWVDQVQVQVAVASGTLDVTIDGRQDTAQIDLSGTLFKPGDPAVVKTVPITNAGSLPAVVTITMTGKGAAYLGSQLDSTVSVLRPPAAAVTATGKASSVTLATLTVPPNTSYQLEVRLSLPASTDNSWQGKNDVLTINAAAVQA